LTTALPGRAFSLIQLRVRVAGTRSPNRRLFLPSLHDISFGDVCILGSGRTWMEAN
jgi:hypothetical protein